MKPLIFLSDLALELFGAEELSTLCDFYAQKQTVTWQEEGNEKRKIAKPIRDAVEHTGMIYCEEKYPLDTISELWWYLNRYRHDQFLNLLTLAFLPLTCNVHCKL